MSLSIGVVFESRAGRVYGLDRLEDAFWDDQFEAFSQTVNHYSRHGKSEARGATRRWERWKMYV